MENHPSLQPAQPGGSGVNSKPGAAGPIEFWRILRRRKGALILFAFAGALIGFLFTRPQRPIYQARTSIEIVGLNDNFLNTKQVKPVAETGTNSETADMQTQVKILLSESLLGRVLDKLRRKNALDLSGEGLFSAWRRAFHIDDPPPADRRKSTEKEAATGGQVGTTALQLGLVIRG